MAKEITEITDRIASVTRRGFLSGTAGAIATSGAALALPEDADHASSLRQTALVLHDAIGRYSNQNARFFAKDSVSLGSETSLRYSMECLRDCSVDEIQQLLKPLYESGQGGAS